MFEKAEQEYQDLKQRKSIIENDKDKIEKVIAELDAKKNETLKKAWAKVNRDFGSIFSTLLPGANAKLEPEEGKTVRKLLDPMRFVCILRFSAAERCRCAYQDFHPRTGTGRPLCVRRAGQRVEGKPHRAEWGAAVR